MPVPKGYTLDQPVVTPPPGYTLDGAAPAAPPVAAAAPPSPAATPTTPTPAPGFLGSFADASGLSTLGHAIMHPVDTAKVIGQALNPANIGNEDADNNPILKAMASQVDATIGGVKKAAHDFSNIASWKTPMASADVVGQATGLPLNVRRDLVGAIPIVGPAVQGAQAQYDAGNKAGAAGTIAGAVAGVAGPKALESVPGMAKGFLRGPVDEPIVGTSVTPAARFASAKNLGVNLDAADATNNPLLQGVKKLNENSLLGGNSYDILKASNTAALGKATDGFLTSLYDGDRESGGADIQGALKADQAGLHGDATEGFQKLPQDYPLPGAADLGTYAQQLKADQTPYYGQFPSLQPNKAMNVLDDVGRLSPNQPVGAKFPWAQTNSDAAANFGTIQRLRSDLLDFNRNNPDIVKNQSGGWMQDLAGKADSVMTNGANGLPPEQASLFRAANAKWEDMKKTYDDPSSPLYQAVRTQNPSTLYGGIGSKTAENAQNLVRRLAPGEEPSPALGALRRGTVEGALKTTNDGSPNFKTFGTQLNRVPADYRASLFSPDQNVTLKDLTNTSNVLARDFNPSGSAKMGQKVLEGSALAAAPLHPLSAVAPLAQYPIAKFMTNPKAVDWLMSPAAKPNPFFAPTVGVAAAEAASSKKKGLYGR